MTSTHEGPRTGGASSPGSLVGWGAAVCLLVCFTLSAGVGIAALLAEQGATADWSRWSDVGQTFGALSSIISGLALVAIVVAARMQSKEMQANREELADQRLSLMNSHVQLQRSASASLGMLHLEILKMGIEDEDLARVWPPFEPNLPAEQNRQYLYANIIYQFQFRAMQHGDYTEEEILAALRYLFTSPVMRGYWRAAAFGRKYFPGDSPEFAFAQNVDEVCREFEAVVDAATRDDVDETVLLRERREATEAA
jgi:hypothetical protein